MSDLKDLMLAAAARGAAFREADHVAPVTAASLDLAAARETLGSLRDEPADAAAAVEQLAAACEPLLVRSTGPRYFGFVIGGSVDAAVAADVLTIGWDQDAFNPALSPAAALVEEVAGSWLRDILRLPSNASFGFVTGGQAANTVCLAAARHHVLAQIGWDVERDGLQGAPRVRVVAGAERHATIDRSLRLLGFGAGTLELVPADAEGAIDVEGLASVLASREPGPTILCLQAGNVNSGAFDDFTAAVPMAHEHSAWVHVDGAFGLWAAAAPERRHLVADVEAADSWSADGHKWLNVPYDCGFAFTAHPTSHAAAMAITASYLTPGPQELRSPTDFVPESSRRARGFATWAALRQLGRSGVADLVERCCALAMRFAEQLSGVDGVTLGNDVVLNQVLVRFGDDERTDAVIDSVQRSGECWMGGTTWRGERHMRISVSNWQTTAADVDRSVAAIRAAMESG